MSWTSAADTEAQKRCVNEALWSGCIAGAWAGGVGACALGLASHFSPAVRGALGPSGKAAMVVLPALGVVFLEVEWRINACARRERGWAASQAGAEPQDILPKRTG